MQECYDQLDEDDSEFLGNRFPGKDGERVMHLVVTSIVIVVENFR